MIVLIQYKPYGQNQNAEYFYFHYFGTGRTFEHRA